MNELRGHPPRVKGLTAEITAINHSEPYVVTQRCDAEDLCLELDPAEPFPQLPLFTGSSL